MESKPIASSRSLLAGKYGKKGKAGRSQLLMIKPAVMPNTPLVRTQKNRAAQFTVGRPNEVMNMNFDIFEKQLKSIIDVYKSFQQKSQHNDLSDLPKNDRQSLVTRGIAAIHRISGTNSTYSNQVERLLKNQPQLHLHTTSIMGVVQALRDDIEAGYVATLVELVHGDIFADFLEMGKHLLDTGYKDAAAVIAGSTLESHIRELCNKHGLPIEETNNKGNQRPKKTDRLNADLTEIRGQIYC